MCAVSFSAEGAVITSRAWTDDKVYERWRACIRLSRARWTVRGECRACLWYQSSFALHDFHGRLLNSLFRGIILKDCLINGLSLFLFVFSKGLSCATIIILALLFFWQNPIWLHDEICKSLQSEICGLNQTSWIPNSEETSRRIRTATLFPALPWTSPPTCMLAVVLELVLSNRRTQPGPQTHVSVTHWMKKCRIFIYFFLQTSSCFL